MPRKPYRTKNQIEIMGIILKAAGEGRFLNVGEIHAQITYGSSYGALRTSMRGLVKENMLVRQKDGTATLMIPTERGYDWFRPLRNIP